MEDEIYIAKKIGAKIKSLPRDQAERILDAIETLKNDGWRNSQIIAPQDSSDGGLRSAILGNLQIYFSYMAEKHALIIVDVATIVAHDLVAAD
jgi:mRNA-degrading endonuclease RelE of RelBE toxin-antitoxin system